LIDLNEDEWPIVPRVGGGWVYGKLYVSACYESQEYKSYPVQEIKTSVLPYSLRPRPRVCVYVQAWPGVRSTLVTPELNQIIRETSFGIPLGNAANPAR